MNILRKEEPSKAALYAKHMLDTVMMTSGIPVDQLHMSTRTFQVLEEFLGKKTIAARGLPEHQ